MSGLWARLKAWAKQQDVIPTGGQWPEPFPDAPKCGTFSGPICLHEMPANGRTGAVKWICGAPLPCGTHMSDEELIAAVQAASDSDPIGTALVALRGLSSIQWQEVRSRFCMGCLTETPRCPCENDE